MEKELSSKSVSVSDESKLYSFNTSFMTFLQRDEQEMEVEKSIQKKTEDYERSRDEKYKFEIDILQSKLQSIREIKIRGMVTRKICRILLLIHHFLGISYF
jgi:hypothetical protein